MKTAIVTALAYAISFGSIPLITHIYEPTELGLFSVFSLLVMASIPLMSLCNETGISNARNRQEIDKYSKITLKSTIYNGIFLTLLLYILKVYTDLLNILEYWMIALVTLTSALGILYSVGLSIAMQNKADNEVRASIFINQTSRPISQIIFGLMSSSFLSLIMADLFGRILSIIRIKVFVSSSIIINYKSSQRISHFDTQYARWTLPKMLVDNLMFWSPPFIITLTYGAHEGGLFALTQRLGTALVSFYNFVVGAFFQRSLVFDEYEGWNEQKSYILRSYLKIFLISLFSLIVLNIIGQDLISTVLGKMWTEANEIIKITIPMYTIQMCYVLVDRFLIYKNRLRELLVMNICILLVQITTAYLISVINLDIYTGSIIWVSTVVLGYVCCIIYFFFTTKNIKNIEEPRPS